MHIDAQTNVYGSYLDFNGDTANTVGDFIEIPDHTTLNFDDTQGFSIQLWINPSDFDTSANAFQGIVTKKTASGDGYGIFWSVSPSGDGTVQLLLKETAASGGSSKVVSTPVIADINNFGWAHLSVVVKRYPAPAVDSAYLYLNSELVTREEISDIGDVTNAEPLRLMNYAGNTTDRCSGGSLDEVRIWDIALTRRQIHRFYQEPIDQNLTAFLLGKVRGGFTGKRSFQLNWSNLVGYWDMEETQPTYIVTDKSANSNNGQFFSGSTSCAVGSCGPDFVNFCIGCSTYRAKAAFVADATGNWSDPNTWSAGIVPNATDALVFITNGATVTVDGTFNVEDLNIENGATVTATSLSLLEVVKYMHIDGTLDCKTAGNVLFDEVGSH